MNEYIEAQILQMKVYVKNWEAACELAAKKNDSIKDRAERKALKRIHKATTKFVQHLDKI